jgi:hypothetical protein
MTMVTANYNWIITWITLSALSLFCHVEITTKVWKSMGGKVWQLLYSSV